MNEHIKQLTQEYLRSIFTDEEIEERTTEVENSETDYVAGIQRVLKYPEEFGLTENI